MLPQKGPKNEYKLPQSPQPLIKIHQSPIYVIKFNKSGEYCMTGSEDRSVSLYNPSKNLMIKNYKNLHNYDVHGLDIANDNSKFATGGGDKAVVLTDVVQGKYIRKYTGHTHRVNTICFNQENNVIVSGSYDMSIKIWDNRANANLPIETIKSFKDSVSQVQILDYQIIAGSIDGSMKFFDIRKGQLTSDSIQQGVQRFSIANSGKAYAISATNSRIYLIDRLSGKKVQEYQGHDLQNYTVDCCFNLRDTHILTGSSDGSLYFYDIMKSSPIKSVKAHEKALSALAVHQDTGYVTAGHDGLVCFWKM